MQLTFLGATKTVTGSKYLISFDNKKILIDCGLFQGYKELRLRNWDKFPVDPSSIDAVILTHAHLDHTGYLPLLAKNGFSGKIYSTHGTKDLCAILLPDSGFIQEEDALRANKYNYSKHRPALPLYTKEDATQVLKQFVPLEFGKKYPLFESLTFEFLPGGHIIGASLVRLEYQGKSIVFTGDLGRPIDPVMLPPAIVTAADYLIIESTYGDRLHDRTDPLNDLENIIQQTVNRGGSVIIPAFAVGRAQIMLYYMYMLKKAKRIPNIPVFLDSPMAENASDLLAKYTAEHRLSKAECKAVCGIASYAKTPEDSKLIDQYHTPIIVISASGMATGGRVLHHLKKFLPDHRNTILFTGYQAGGTRGDKLVKGEKTIKIMGEMIAVHAQIALISNLSAHADYEEILAWLQNFHSLPKQVYITHGDKSAAEALKNKIQEKYHWPCTTPTYLQTVTL